MRTALVLGATGFVGRSVVVELDALLGETNVALVSTSRTGAVRAPELAGRLIHVDGWGSPEEQGSLPRADVVFDCSLPPAASIPAVAQASADLADRAGSRLVFLSSRAAEAGHADPATRLHTPYAWAKAEAERRVAATLENRVTVLRPGLVWGVGSMWSPFIFDVLDSGALALPAGTSPVAHVVHAASLARTMVSGALNAAHAGGARDVIDDDGLDWPGFFSSIAAGASTRLSVSTRNPSNDLKRALRVIPARTLASRSFAKRAFTSLPSPLASRVKHALSGGPNTLSSIQTDRHSHPFLLWEPMDDAIVCATPPSLRANYGSWFHPLLRHEGTEQ